ncbi:hypothetical protein [Butyrivibrio sp. VCB2006]|nr:hypothetical protein [Butyrivibrio sp. VCB2006]
MKKNEKLEKMEDIKVKESPHARAIKNAPEEALARAIHDALIKDREKK